MDEEISKLRQILIFFRYTPGSGDLPGANTLQSDYLPKCGEERRESIKESIKDKPLVVVADETSDTKGRCVFAVLLRTITPTEKQEVFLASCSFLDVANGTSCCQAIIDTLQRYEIKYDQVMGLVSDSARYMGTCFTALQTLIGEHILHHQCWAHKVNLCGDVFMKELKELNTVVSKVKMAFLHGRKIKNAYIHYLQTHYPALPAVLFPSPIITRWNSWFCSVKYINTYLEPLIGFFKEVEYSNTSTTAVVEMFDDAVSSTVVRIQIKFVSEMCLKFVELINVLEGSAFPYAHLLWDHLENLVASLQQASEGAFKSNTREALERVSNMVVKAKITASLKDCAQKSSVKLNTHMLANKTNDLYRAAHTLFNPSIAGQQAHPNVDIVKKLKNKMPAFKEMSEDNFVEDYMYFHRQLVKAVKEGTVDLVQLLLAMKINKKEFSNASLTTIWAPVNSVDAERFFSSYNLVLTDRRTRMKESTIETCAMLSFNSGK